MSKRQSLSSAKPWEGFYEPEQMDSQYLTGFPNSFFYIKDILKQRLKKGRLQYFVSWQGWPSKYNSWVYGETIMPVQELLRSNESTQPTNICPQQQKERLGQRNQTNKLQCEVTIAQEPQKLEKTQSNKIRLDNRDSIDKSKKKLRRSQTKKNSAHLDSNQNENYFVQTKIEEDFTSHVFDKFEKYQNQKRKSKKKKNVEKLPKRKTKKDIKQIKKKNLLKESPQSIKNSPQVPLQNQTETKQQQQKINIPRIRYQKQEQIVVKNQKDVKDQKDEKEEIKILKQKQRLQHNIDGLNMSSQDINNLRTISSLLLPNMVDINKSALTSNCRAETVNIENKQKQKFRQIEKQMDKQIEKQIEQQLQKIPSPQQKKNPQNKTIQKSKQVIGNQNKYLIDLGQEDDGQISKMSFDSFDDYSAVSSVSKPNTKKQYPRADIKITKFFNRKNKKRNASPIVKTGHTNNKNGKLKQAQNINSIDEADQQKKLNDKFAPKNTHRKKQARDDFNIDKPSDFNSEQVVGKLTKNEQDEQQKCSGDNTSLQANQSLLLSLKPAQKSQKSAVNQQVQNILFNKCLSKLSDTNLLQNSIQSQSALYPIQEEIIKPIKNQKQINKINESVINKCEQDKKGNHLEGTSVSYSLLLNQTMQANHNNKEKKYENQNNTKQYSVFISQPRQQHLIDKNIEVNPEINDKLLSSKENEQVEELPPKTQQDIEKCEQKSCQDAEVAQKQTIQPQNMIEKMKSESKSKSPANSIRTEIQVFSIEYSNSQRQISKGRNSYFNDEYYSLYSEEESSVGYNNDKEKYS